MLKLKIILYLLIIEEESFIIKEYGMVKILIIEEIIL